MIWDVADVRRCIAPDLPAHGATAVPTGDAADLSLNGLAAMLHDLCEALGLDQVDVVANDTGGAVAQVFAARYPQRMRTLTLTNCDVHDNFPPEAFKPFVALAESGEFGPMVAAMAGDLALARSEVGFGHGLRAPRPAHRRAADELSRPVPSRRGQGPRALPHRVLGGRADGRRAAARASSTLRRRWRGGRRDIFFEPSWAERLADMIPGVERVTLFRDAMLFWPDERAADLVPLLRDFWEAHA